MYFTRHIYHVVISWLHILSSKAHTSSFTYIVVFSTSYSIMHNLWTIFHTSLHFLHVIREFPQDKLCLKTLLGYQLVAQHNKERGLLTGTLWAEVCQGFQTGGQCGSHRLGVCCHGPWRGCYRNLAEVDKMTWIDVLYGGRCALSGLNQMKRWTQTMEWQVMTSMFRMIMML